MVRKHVAVEPSAASFDPVRLVEIDLGQPLSGLAAQQAPDGRTYLKALLFLRLHSEPVGLVEVSLEGGSLDPTDIAAMVWPHIADKVRRHLARDDIDSAGVSGPSDLEILQKDVPPCIRKRDDFLADAPALTVLIPSRERPDRLRRCLDSVLASDYPAERIALLVIDNAPNTDATQELVDSYLPRSNIRYLRENTPGSASARNRGLREVDTDYVLMTDDDTIVDRYWLAEVAQTFRSFPEATTVSGLLLPMELDTPAQVWFEQYGGFGRGFERRVFDLVDHRPTGEPLYPWTAGLFGTGNNISFRTAAIREFGGYDPALGNGTPALGGEDSELLLRTILSGGTIVYEPRAVVRHAHRPNYADLQGQLYSYGAGLTAYYLKTLLSNPRLALDFVRKIPLGVRFALSPSSSKNDSKREDYPRELTRLELKGMLYGPIGYARSRWRYGPHVVRSMTPGAQVARTQGSPGQPGPLDG